MLNGTNRTVREQIANALGVGMEAVVEANGCRDTAALDGLVDALAVLEPTCNGLFEIEVLPRLDDSKCELGVLLGRRADHDRVDVVVVKAAPRPSSRSRPERWQAALRNESTEGSATASHSDS